MHVVDGHGATGTAKDGRFVHIVPNAVDTRGHEILIQCAPPMTHLRAREVGEVAGTRPHIAHERLSIGRLHPVVASCALIVNKVAWLGLYARINHIDRLEITTMQIVVESFWIGELTGIEREDAITIHVVDVHPNDVRRYLMLTKQVGYLHDTRIRLIAEAALLITKRP